MKPSERDEEVAHTWVRTKLTLCDDSGRPYPNHVNEVSQLLTQAREEGRQEERGEVVAWLRAPETTGSSSAEHFAQRFAERIGRCEHKKRKEGA